VLAMPDDLPDLRASHGDRDRVVEALRIAAGDGRLNAEELDSRLERALTAQTFGELAGLTADLVLAGDDLLVVEQQSGKYVKEGHWRVPARIKLRTGLCRVRLDFTHAVITVNVLHIDTEMVHGKLLIISSPGIMIDADGLNRTYSKVKLHPKDAADPLLHIKLIGTLVHAKVIEQRPRR
jgi:hypothetical protein